jgi:patatin-like phospholipase/acyl hydrolase
MEQVWGVPIIHCFDWICGTSTGAILALALSSGKSVLECQALYFRLKDKVSNYLLHHSIGLKTLVSFLHAVMIK